MALLLNKLHGELQEYFDRIEEKDRKCKEIQMFIRKYAANLCKFAEEEVRAEQETQETRVCTISETKEKEDIPLPP